MVETKTVPKNGAVFYLFFSMNCIGLCLKFQFSRGTSDSGCATQLVSPGAWLCDLTLERYEVREKKITKKVPPIHEHYLFSLLCPLHSISFVSMQRPRGLKAMGNVDSDSE